MTDDSENNLVGASSSTIEISCADGSLPGAAHRLNDLLGALEMARSQINAGQWQACAQFELAWRAAEQQLEVELFEQLREEYLRHALALWESCLAEDGNPEAALAATDFLCLLFED